MKVYQFYGWQLANEELTKVVGVDALRKLKNWKKEVALEVGALKEWDCVGNIALRDIKLFVDNAIANGGAVHHLAMDEPLLAGVEFCKLSEAETTNRTAQFMKDTRAALPGLTLGSIEPYPHFKFSQLATFLNTLVQKGSKPDFFHLDVDRNHPFATKDNLIRDLRKFRDLCQSLGIPFGVILNSHKDSSDQTFFVDSQFWITIVDEAIGAPDRSIFQSWSTKAVPKNLPDSGNGVFSLTKLLVEGFDYLTR
ncbi:MAG: hypothetical protein IT289_00250 [Oligoflexia bacterium]|nr:hypothetical protein [Oligoflexia bacterium]